MIQQVRQDEPQYRCVVSVESVTGRSNEELMAFGTTAAAQSGVESLLRSGYDCTEAQITQLMQQAETEPLSHWCSVSSDQGEDELDEWCSFHPDLFRTIQWMTPFLLSHTPKLAT
ncbi:MAG TPA: hypothetical protein V6C65_31180 [Allocoleopsis sp.]